MQAPPTLKVGVKGVKGVVTYYSLFIGELRILSITPAQRAPTSILMMPRGMNFICYLYCRALG